MYKSFVYNVKYICPAVRTNREIHAILMLRLKLIGDTRTT